MVHLPMFEACNPVQDKWSGTTTGNLLTRKRTIAFFYLYCGPRRTPAEHTRSRTYSVALQKELNARFQYVVLAISELLSSRIKKKHFEQSTVHGQYPYFQFGSDPISSSTVACQIISFRHHIIPSTSDEINFEILLRQKSFMPLR